MIDSELKNSGFIAPTLDNKNYIFGSSSVPFLVIKPDGNWLSSAPIKELQKLQFETYNCTSFNTLNQIENYMLEVFGEVVNYSDRWLGIVAKTKPPGNDPHTVLEAIRKYGLIPEEMLPYSADLKNVEEYYSFKGADEEACKKAGLQWLERFDFFHEYCFDQYSSTEEKIKNIKLCLTTSPVTLDVYAWFRDSRGIYIKAGQSNHWTMVYSYKDLSKVYDSYDPVFKDVDQESTFAKRIYIVKKDTSILNKKPLKPWYRNIYDIITNIIKYVNNR